jgi:hypothetical protein
MISGTFNLEKEEWIGILNLATRWQMKKVSRFTRTRTRSLKAIIQAREHAIKHLSGMTLTAVEKVVLAQSHKVAKWLTEGLTEIVTEDPIRPFDELKSLGLETASLLLWIRDQTVSRANVQGFDVTLGGLGCNSCKAAMFTSAANCRVCNQEILIDDPEALYLPNCSVQIQDTGTRPGRSQVVLNLQSLRCRHCNNYPLNLTTYSCPSCSYSVGYTSFRLLFTGLCGKRRADVTVEEVFKEEIASYESWDH